jgi:integrase
LVEEQEKELLGLLQPRKLREAAEEPISKHLNAFVAHQKEFNRSEDHVRHTYERVTALCAACRWQQLRDANADGFVKWRNRQSTLSPKTLNEYLGHAVALFNWLVRNERFTHNPLKSVQKLPTAGAETFKRRALSREEFVRFMEAGGKRRLVYFVAACTGLRRGEMKQLIWSDLELDCSAPCVRLRPETTKNKKGGTLPLVPTLADLLRTERSRVSNVTERVFPRGLPSVKTLAKDLEVCGIPFEDERGYRADFHALRHTFISLLAGLDMTELVRRKLARHESLKMTDRYTDDKSVPLANGIAKLAEALPSSLASPNFGKTCPKEGNTVPDQTNRTTSVSSGNVLTWSALSNVVHVLDIQLSGAQGGTRTPMLLRHRLLRPACLPIPPPGQMTDYLRITMQL